MAKVRKPIPPTQRELSLKQHTAFDQEQGNPNSFVEDGKTNRSLNLSFKDDNTKPFSVGIKDIDEAIFYYFQNIIKPTVIQNGQILPVPVIYASPEKMKSYQKDGYYRDQNGKIQAPLISFKRESIDKNRTIANKLDANNPNNFGVFTKKYNPKNAYDNFHVLNNRVPVKTHYAVVMPDYLTITYSFTVFTYYVEQLNKIIEAIEYASDAYWGDPQLFQFRAMIDSFNFQTELNTSDERLVRSTFTVKLNGYIVPEVIQRDLNAVKKFNDKAKILLAIETDVSFKDPASLSNVTKSPKKVTFAPSAAPSIPSILISTSDFSSDKLTANTGELITFTDLTTNAPTSWLWMFGDGTSSSLQNPTKTYSTSGTYSVTLISGRNNSSGIVTKINYITIL
jgi:PKD repeat protein